MTDQEKCPHRWMHGVMTCPHCGLAERVDDTDALRHELNDWRQFGFAHAGPPITCDQDMRDAIENERRVLCSELSALRLEVAAWRALAEWCAGRPQRRIDSQELFGKRNVAVLDGIGNERVSDWFDATGPAVVDLARKLQLIPAEPDESREGRER